MNEEKRSREGRRLWIYLLAFLAARTEAAGMHPFAVAVFGAVYLAGCGSWGLYGAILLGIASTFSLTGILKYGVILIFITLGILWTVSGRRQENPLTIAGLTGGITMLTGEAWRMLPTTLTDVQTSWYMPVLEGILTACFTVILERAFRVIRNRENGMRSENLLSTLTLTAIVLWGVPLQIGYVLTALQGVVYYLLLYISYRCGAAYGTSMGTVCGVILAVRTQQVEWVAICVILSLAAAFLGEWGKWLELFGSLALIGFLGFFYYPQLLEVQALRGLGSACVLFACTPKRYLLKHTTESRETEEQRIDSEVQKLERLRLQDLADVFTRLGRSFSRPVYAAGSEGQLVQIPFFARQMGELGANLSDFAGTAYTPLPVNRRKEARLLHALERQNVRVRHMLLLRGLHGRRELYLSARTVRGRIMTVREAAEIVSEAFGSRYRAAPASRMVINREYNVVVLEEDTHYRYLTGAARVAQEGQKISGDNFSQLELKNGQLLMLLADGMGSGEEAARQSGQLVDLLEEMLEAGFRKESAIELLNELIAVQGQGDSFATLDLCMLDLYSGVGEFLKMGASTTFIQRGSWMESIQSTTLPVGVREETDMDIVRKKLYHGDRIIMVSDGVLDGIVFEKKEECLKELILEIDTRSPQELADELLNRVKKMNGGSMRDDASVLVLGIWKK